MAASTIDRRLSTVCGFYRFAHIDGRIAANPAQYVRRPKVHPGDAGDLDRSELGAFLFAAERFDAAHAALAVLLGLNGLRVSEACSTDIENLGFERGHRTLRIIGKGNKPAVIPLVPRTARTTDIAIGERTTGPILRRHGGQRLDRRTAHRWVRSIAKRAGLGQVHPHMLRAAFIMCTLDAAFLYGKSKSPLATPIPGRPPSTTTAAKTSTSTPRTLSSRSSQEAESPTAHDVRPFAAGQFGTIGAWYVLCGSDIGAHVLGQSKSDWRCSRAAGFRDWRVQTCACRLVASRQAFGEPGNIPSCPITLITSSTCQMSAMRPSTRRMKSWPSSDKRLPSAGTIPMNIPCCVHSIRQ